MKALFNDAMEPEVLSWDNAGNNRFMTAGKGSWIQNPSSHYISAKTSKLPVAEQIYFHQTPAGPRGRHTAVNLRSMGVWKFSKEVDLGKELIRHLFNEERYIDYVTSSDNYNHPIFRKFEDSSGVEHRPEIRAIQNHRPVLPSLYLAGSPRSESTNRDL